MNKLIKILGFLVLSGFIAINALSQVSINGPTCVISRVIYQYTINGNWDSTSTMQVCINGGVIADSTDTNTCTPSGGAPLAAVRVIWNNRIGGSLVLTSTKGNTSLNISLTVALAPGNLDSATRSQTIGYDSFPTTINCSADSGGSCSPYYADQWQQSPDMVSWTDIEGATSQNLSFSSPLTQTTFFRRKVTDTSSGSISYSDAAVIAVYPQLAQTDSSTSQLTPIENKNTYSSPNKKRNKTSIDKDFDDDITPHPINDFVMNEEKNRKGNLLGFSARN